MRGLARSVREGTAEPAAERAGRGRRRARNAARSAQARPLASYHLLLASAGLLLVVGLTMVFSATSVHAYATDGNAFTAVAEQATYALVGLVAFWICQRLPVRTFRALAAPLLVAAFVMQGCWCSCPSWRSRKVIAATDGSGPIAARGPVAVDRGLSVQPSEMAKLALVLWAADVLARKGAAVADWRELMRPLFPVAALLLLLVGYHDLGTMLCLLMLFVGLLWAAGVRLRVFVAMGWSGWPASVALILARSSYRWSGSSPSSTPTATS